LAAQAKPVLVLGADSPIGLTVVRELGARGVPVIAHGRSDRALGRYSRFASEFVLETRPLAAWLPAFAAARGLGAVMAVSEGHLLELAALQGRLGECRVLSPDAAALARVLDKSQTFAAAEHLGIAVPGSWQPVAGEDHAARAAQIVYPVAIKWADPNAVQRALSKAGIALEKVEYAADAGGLTAILVHYDPLGQWPLVQQFCPGYGLGQMLHMADGAATLRFQHRRLREFPPSGGVSSLCASVPLDQHMPQMARSEALLAALDWHGPAMVEYRFDPASGTYWLMEINGRFWGSIPLAWHCGAHFAWESYRRAELGEESPFPVGRGRGGGTTLASSAHPRPLPPGEGSSYRQRRARYVIPDAKRTVLVLRDSTVPMAQRLAALAQFWLDFLDPRVRYYVWSLRDPGPLLGDLAGIVRQLLRRDSA
jgi:predicted ATP-grasp superfamily ATP-dependent carboligase